MRRHERGFALPIVLGLLILASAGSALILTRIGTVRRETAVRSTSVEALWAVEGAIETARHALARGETVPGEMRLGQYEIRIQVTATNAGWLLRARTHPNTAEVEVGLDKHEGALPAIRTWRRLQ